MKKLKLSELNLGNAEVLTRKQLKKVLGGLSLGSGGGLCGTPDANGDCPSGNCTLDCGNGTTSQGTCGSSYHHTKCSCVGIC